MSFPTQENGATSSNIKSEDQQQRLLEVDYNVNEYFASSVVCSCYQSKEQDNVFAPTTCVTIGNLTATLARGAHKQD
jgi:hypothetical protein